MAFCVYIIRHCEIAKRPKQSHQIAVIEGGKAIEAISRNSRIPYRDPPVKLGDDIVGNFRIPKLKIPSNPKNADKTREF
ncbi:MAG: hypothetical protein MSC46_07190 [Campylobacter sp.]|nr:hypothetical protein [Campylobacter sp.]